MQLHDLFHCTSDRPRTTALPVERACPADAAAAISGVADGGIARGFAARMPMLAAVLVLALMVAPAFAGILPPPTVFTVGNTASCTHNSVQAAINAAPAAGNTIIRISNNVAHNNQALSLNNRNIELRGGYPGCGLQPPDSDARTTLRGNGGDSVLFINASVNPRTVILRNLVIRGGGSSDVVTERGGGVRIQGTTRVEIRNSRISDNESHAGGGIYVLGANAELVLDDGSIVGEASGIAANRAVANGPAGGAGGGIYCVGADVRILDARLRLNTSVQDGGGLYAVNCDTEITPRPAFVEGTNGGNGFVTFFENSADRNGGALYADGGQVFWYSAEVDGAFSGRATGNRATERGGALYLTGLTSFVGSWLRFEDNRADGRGGAIAVEDSSNLILRGGPGFACAGPNCSGIFGSRGITEGESASLIGGAVYAESGSTVSLRQQKLFQNRAVSGSAISLFTGGTTADLRSVLIARNFLYGMGSDRSTVNVTGEAAIEMRYVTMAGNLRASAMFPGVDRALSSLLASGAEASVELRNSLFWNDGYEVLRTPLFGTAVTGSCVLAHENDTFAPASIADPMYVDTTGDSPDFRLQPGSPAIDRCAASGSAEADVRGRARPQDLALPNLDGPYDAGAYEALFFIVQEPEVFSDGFEQPLP